MPVVKAHQQSIEKAVRAIGAPAAQVELTVEDVRGLCLVVKPSGTVSWLVRYQIGKGAKRVRRASALGRYGDGGLSLADAREAAEAYWKAAAKGVDKVEVDKADALTLRKLFELRQAEDKDTEQSTLDGYAGRLERYVFPTLGKKSAGSITPEQIAAVLRTVEKHSRDVAHQVRSALGGTYRWAQSRHHIVANPVAVLGFHHATKPRKRDLSDADLHKLWAAIDKAQKEHKIFDSMARLLRVAVLTGQRNSECAGMMNAELNLEAGEWNIPAQRMKRKSDDQFVALSRQALAIVHEQIAAGSDGQYVFPGSGRGRKGGVWRAESISQQSVSRAFAKVAKMAGLKNLRLHDMRKVLVSWLSENDHAEPHILDALLHHGGKNVTATHYNHAKHKAKVRAAWQIWASFVEPDAVDAGAASNVHQLRG
jgi:integrase